MIRHHVRFILIGLGLLLGGWAVIFLMVIRTLPQTFFLNGLGYAASFGGFILGLFGIVEYRKARKRGE